MSHINPTFSYEVALCDSTSWQNDSGRYDKVEQVRGPLQQRHKEEKSTKNRETICGQHRMVQPGYGSKVAQEKPICVGGNTVYKG